MSNYKNYNVKKIIGSNDISNYQIHIFINKK